MLVANAQTISADSMPAPGYTDRYMGRFAQLTRLCAGFSLIAVLVIGCASDPKSDQPASTQPGGDGAAATGSDEDADDITNAIAARRRQLERKRQLGGDEENERDAASRQRLADQRRVNGNASADANANTHRVAGMVGQVNGEAIYASEVFKPLREQLQSLGARLSVAEFRGRAQQLIRGRLDQLVTDSLILGEAQRDLSERQRQGLKAMMAQRREELIRKHGRGSVAVADSTLKRETGKGLEETLEDKRQQMLVQRYVRQKLLPRINVTRRDIERYYRDNEGRFNPPATRSFRLIRVADEAAADRVAQRLEAGETFKAIAQSGLNEFQTSQGGLMEDMQGEEVFGYDALNDAMLELDEGEHAGPIAIGGQYWFVKVVKLDQPEGKPLKEVQRQIESALRAQQFRRLQEEYRRTLYERGSYNPIDQMTAALVQIAVSRYTSGAE